MGTGNTKLVDVKNIFHQDTLVSRDSRVRMKKQNPVVLWFTGLSGSGKSTLASELNKKLVSEGRFCYMLDGDNIRFGINSDLDFSEKGRKENIRRIAEISKLFIDAGEIVLTAFVSPFKQDRENAKKIIGQEDFIEIYVDTPLDICETRDVKGLYKKARKGEISYFTGISSPYEPPEKPDIHICTMNKTIVECVSEIHTSIANKILLK